MLARFRNYRTIFRFDLVARWIAVHALVHLVGLRVGHWRGDSRFAIGLQFALHVLNQLVVVLSREPTLYVDQATLEARDGIALAPVIEQFGRHVLRGIVDGVSLHAHHLSLNEGRALAAMGALARLIGCVVDLAGIGAIHNHSWNPIRNGPLRQVIHAKLHIAGSGIAPQVVLDHKHQAQLLHSREVQALVGDSGGLPTIADVSEARHILALQARAQTDAGHYAD